jgi:hypothetical protein
MQINVTFNVTRLDVFMLRVIKLSIVMVSVIVLSVVAPSVTTNLDFEATNNGKNNYLFISKNVF